jgi:hypothetical protein
MQAERAMGMAWVMRASGLAPCFRAWPTLLSDNHDNTL